MSRHYVLGTWANADEYNYSGEQLMGHRQGKSVCMDHTLPSGMANLSRYGDPVAPTKPKVKRSAFEQATLADSRYARLQRLTEALDDDLENGEISLEDYIYAKKALQPRIDRAWKQIAKGRGWEEQEETTEEIYQPQAINRNKELNNSFTTSSELAKIFLSLSNENVFRQMYEKANKLINIWKEVVR